MVDKGKRYWFYLEPYVYVSVKGQNVLLLNLADGRFLTFMAQPHVAAFIRQLERKENLYVLEVSEDDLKGKGLQDFVRDVREHFMGDLVDVSLTGKKPFILSPNFDIRDGVPGGVQVGDITPARRTFKNVAKDSFLALKELTVYIEDSCGGNCPECGTAFKQFPWCTRDGNGSRLDPADIAKVLEETRGCFLESIHIIGGDINRYPGLREVMGLLRARRVRVCYYLHMLHLETGGLDKLLGQMGQEAEIHLLVNCASLSDRDMQKKLETLPRDRVKIVFLIQHEHEFTILEKSIEDLQLKEFSVQPYFNGGNLEFFKGNVFTDIESLSSGDLDIKAIKARRSFNTLNYGKLYIRNRQVYSNLNAAPLGEVDKLPLREAVILELKEQGNWLRVRRDVSPCKDCLLDAVCPPLSNFEYAAGINNSCNIWQETD